MDLLRSVSEIDLHRYSIVGDYLRFDERTRAHLGEFRQRVVASLSRPHPLPTNFLLWGSPGSGKSYLVQSIAAELGGSVDFVELNLAQLDEAEFRSRLDAATHREGPLLCFVDEVDAKRGLAWPYEQLLPHLEPPHPRADPTTFVLAGSGGADLAEMRSDLASRTKGRDLLSRLPPGHDFVVPGLGVGDRLLVAIVQLLRAGRHEGRALRAVEKLAIYYIVTSPELTSARALRAVAVEAGQRIPVGEDRLRYDHLFRAGDPRNKAFWAETGSARAELEGRFIEVTGESGPLPPGPTPVGRRGTGPEAADLGRRLAVLPFANISPDPSDGYFADGLSDELISAVARIPELSVISRTSVLQYKSRRATMPEVRRELGVGAVLEGSVRKAGSRIRVSAQLIDTATDSHLWTESYDRELKDIIAIQSDIASCVAEALKVQLVGGKGARAPNAEAYGFYLKGRYLWNRSTAESLELARAQFERAIDLDPGFALGYAGLADTYLLLGRRGDLPVLRAYPPAVSHAQKALELDPTLAEPHAALGSIRQEHEWRFPEAEVEFRRAIELKPSWSTAHAWYALFLGHVGRLREAVEQAEQAIALDPYSARIHAGASEEYLFARQYDRAVGAAARAIEIDPQFGSGYAFQGEAYAEQGRFQEAVAAFERARGLLGAQACRGRLGHALARAGRSGEARELLAGMIGPPAESTSANPFLQQTSYASLDVGLTYLGLGEHDAALEWFARAVGERVPEVVHFRFEPIYDPVREDPRFVRLLERIGLTG